MSAQHDLDAARATIAREWLAATGAGSVRVGSVLLRPHQAEAVARLGAIMEEFGGALLADDVGLGKTFVAAALLREARDGLLVCPASLRAMWRRALGAAGARARIVTYTQLSRGADPAPPAGLLVLDEAHHARTPGTRRYAALARLAGRARVLALSATPVHNARGDLAAVLALFLGERAAGMSDAQLARLIVRREHRDLAGEPLPSVSAPRRVTIADDAALLDAILRLPPAVRPAGGGDGGALVALGLVRQWASSRAALRGAIRRRLIRAAALDAALEAGRLPTARELSAWACDGSTVQLAFPELVARPHDDPAPLRAAVLEHAGALRALLERAAAAPDPDAVRARRLRAIRRLHRGERIVAFAQFADTAHALFRELAPTGGVAALTARGAVVAGGRLSRREAIERFAPRAAGLPPPPRAERIDLLLATDLLSEGIDLGDASVVVHLDLPWTPARLEQRVGRSRRLGAPHARTAVYAFAPPASAEQVLAVERRLNEKLAAAARITGVAGTILPSLDGGALRTEGATRSAERIRRVIAPWAAGGPMPESRPVIAAGRAPRRALLALLSDDGRPHLAARLDDAPLSDDPAAVLAAADLAARARPCGLAPPTLARGLAAAGAWMERQRALHALGGAPLFRTSPRRTALQRVAAIARRAPVHRRAIIAPFAAVARRVLATPFGVGAEHVLGTLATAPMADEAWLRALAEFGAIHAAERTTGAADARRLLALIIMEPEERGE